MKLTVRFWGFCDCAPELLRVSPLYQISLHLWIKCHMLMSKSCFTCLHWGPLLHKIFLPITLNHFENHFHRVIPHTNKSNLIYNKISASQICYKMEAEVWEPAAGKTNGWTPSNLSNFRNTNGLTNKWWDSKLSVPFTFKASLHIGIHIGFVCIMVNILWIWKICKFYTKITQIR